MSVWSNIVLAHENGLAGIAVVLPKQAKQKPVMQVKEVRRAQVCTQVCTVCIVLKPLSEYYTRSGYWKVPERRCKDCVRKLSRERYK